MPACVSCSMEIAPSWKFCVRCGTPIVHAESPQAAAFPRAATIPRAAILVVALAVVGIGASLLAATVAFR